MWSRSSSTDEISMCVKRYHVIAMNEMKRNKMKMKMKKFKSTVSNERNERKLCKYVGSFKKEIK